MTTNNFTFSEGQYRFTSPVRYFTATDPYYWEIDNIPLKQLEENDLWLKDQLEAGFKNLKFSTGRSDFQELLPYSDSANNVVKVKPGRYTARINDATSSPRLQDLTKTLGQVFNEPTRWRFATYSDEDLKANIDKINSQVANDALFMNGLIERVFTYAVKNPYEAFDDINSNQTQTWFYHTPLLKLFFWPGTSITSTEITQDVTRWNADHGFRSMHLIESFLTKYWRGVFRLSIVDVPEDLSIEIPPFNQRDFDYYDENGALIQNNNASTRIDLLFIYSKPVDAASSKIKSTEQDNSRTITRPELGLVRGAGVLFNRNSPNLGDFATTSPTLDEENNIKILASPADAENTNGGFQSINVRGSFPSPDDLMNVAPLLLENLETSDPRLVGQTVLPVAYIVVRSNASNNEFGELIITNNDIIDIRPFFRTAELSYNERAGIAASVPQLSIANPVVSEMKLKYVANEIQEDYELKLERLQTRLNSFATSTIKPRVVGGGLIQGGRKFGPEAAIRHYHMTYRGLDNQESYDEFRDLYNVPTNLSVPWVPDWDIAGWVPSTSRKEYPNDCVHLHIHSSYLIEEVGDNFEYIGLPYAAGDTSRRLEDLIHETLIFYCKKTIKLDRSAVEWMDHYTVDAQLVNCFPISHPPDEKEPTTVSLAGSSKIWVEYRRDEFTIYCAWPAMQNVPATESEIISSSQREWVIYQSNDRGLRLRPPPPPQVRENPTIYQELFRSGLTRLRNNPEVTAAFTVLTSEMSNGLNRTKTQRGGLCIYPTIKFSITGYPLRHSSVVGLRDSEPTIRLS